jgi:hypothetical protein
VGEGLAGEAADAAVALAERADRRALTIASGVPVWWQAHQVGPQLGFHQDADARVEVPQEARDRPRDVVGQVGALHPRGELP